MNQQVRKQMYYASLSEMRNKLKQYESKPDANAMYLMKQKSYLQAIESYVAELETQVQNERFNKDLLITTVEGEQNGLVPILQKQVRDLQTLLKLRGIDETEQAYLLQDVKEIRRSQSIAQAQTTWKELF